MSIETRPADSGAGTSAPTKLRVIDTDVHHGFFEEMDLLPYVPEEHRERFEMYGLYPRTELFQNNGGYRGGRADLAYDDPSIPVDGRERSVDRCRRGLLDEGEIDIAILTGGQMSPASSAPDSRYASVLCREFNEWSLERWVAEDDRFRLALTVCANDPQGAVEEIERVAGDPRIVCVQFPCGSPRPYGNPMYHPILEACARSGLPIQLHLGNEGGGINPPMTAAGFPTHYIERRIAEPSFYTPHLASFIFEGVFEMWPDLKLVLAETGIPWVPAYVWRMDASWKGLRHQVPWVKKLPSEYFRKNVRLTTQPVDEFDGDPETFRTILDWMDGEDTLMYASNYPHFDWDEPHETARMFPKEMREKIMYKNAEAVYRF